MTAIADPTYVFDVLIDMIAPVKARAGQVLVVRGEQAAVTRRGSAVALWTGTLRPSQLVPLVAQCVVQRRARR